MPLSIPNTTISNQTFTAAATFAGTDVFAYGYFTIANQAAIVQLAVRAQGQAGWGPELYLPPGTYPVQEGTRQPIAGIRFRAAGSASPAAQVFGSFFYPGEVTVQAGNPFTSQVAASGGVTPGSLTLTVQHNGVLVAAEPTLSFDDAASGLLTYTVNDDPANTRVRMQPVLAGGLVIDVLRKITVTDVNTTSTETDLLAGGAVIPANALGSNRTLIAEVSGDFLNTGAAAAPPRLVWRLGGAVGPPPTGTPLIDTGVGGGTVTAASRVGWKARLVMYMSDNTTEYGDLDFEIPGVTPAASTGAVFATGLGQYNLMAANSFLLAKAKGVTNGTVSVLTTSQQLLTLGTINGAALATYSMRCNRARVYILS